MKPESLVKSDVFEGIDVESGKAPTSEALNVMLPVNALLLIVLLVGT